MMLPTNSLKCKDLRTFTSPIHNHKILTYYLGSHFSLGELPRKSNVPTISEKSGMILLLCSLMDEPLYSPEIPGGACDSERGPHRARLGINLYTTCGNR